jgi:hypothetical protein
LIRIPAHPFWTLLAGLTLAGSSPAIAQGDRSFDGPFAVERALALIYGGPVWEDPRISSYPNFETDRAFVEPLFDAAYVEGGNAKHVVIATLTPRPWSEYRCHACSPLIGGAVFRADGDSWTIEAVGTVIGLGHAWYGTHSSLDLVRIGPNRFSLLHAIEDVNGGYESKRVSLIFARDGDLAVRFEESIVESPGPGACGIPEEQHLRVTMGEPDEAGGGALFDLIVDMRWNDARCRMLEPEVATFEGQVCHRVSRYRHTDDAYVLVATERDECTPLPENVRVSLRG